MAPVAMDTTRGGAFGARSDEGSSVKCKTASNASLPGYSPGLFEKKEKVAVIIVILALLLFNVFMYKGHTHTILT